MAKLVRFQPRRVLAERDAAASLVEQLRGLPEGVLQQLPPGSRVAISRATHALNRVARPDTDEGLWPGGFVMLSRIQTAAVWDAIWALPGTARRNQVRRAFDLILLHVSTDTGEVVLPLAEFARRIGTAPCNVSRVMGTLERMGVIRRERRRIAGVQGPGEAVYYVNPHVAWNGSLEVRKAEAARVPPPPLTLMQGGKGKKRAD